MLLGAQADRCTGSAVQASAVPNAPNATTLRGRCCARVQLLRQARLAAARLPHPAACATTPRSSPAGRTKPTKLIEAAPLALEGMLRQLPAAGGQHRQQHVAGRLRELAQRDGVLRSEH